MNNSRGLFVGLTTIDIQYFVEEFPQSNVKIKSESPEFLVGGPATNAAVTFAKLGGTVTLLSAVGKNSFTEFVHNDFYKNGIEFLDLKKEEDFDPVLATVVTSQKNGERNIFTHNPKTINPTVSPEELIEKVSPQVILFDGFYPEFGIHCAQIAKKKNIPVILDCGSWKPQYEEWLNYTDIAICSENFFPQNSNNSQQVFEYLKEKNVVYSAISRGEKTILFQHNNERGELEIERCQVVDTLGAGDILHGAFCYYFIHSNNFLKALEDAAKIATFSCLHKGTRDWLNHFKLK